MHVLNDLETEVRSGPPSAVELGRQNRSRSSALPTEDRVASAQPTETDSLRVLIADDSATTRRFLRAVLEHSPDFVVAGEANDGDAAVKMARSLQPDLVLLDLAMPLVHGTSALSGIRMAAPDATVIVVSGMDPALEVPVLEAGAIAFVPKGVAPSEFLERLGSILDRSLGPDHRAGWETISGDLKAVVCDRDPVTRHLVTQVLDRCGLVVSAETADGRNLLEVVRKTKPELVILGLLADGKPDTNIVSEICRTSPDTTVIVYSETDGLKDSALEAGATAFVLHPRIDELVKRIHSLLMDQ
jgi:DNA-binding NarL/FixJ family response regulator